MSSKEMKSGEKQKFCVEKYFGKIKRFV